LQRKYGEPCYAHRGHNVFDKTLAKLQQEQKMSKPGTADLRLTSWRFNSNILYTDRIFEFLFLRNLSTNKLFAVNLAANSIIFDKFFHSYLSYRQILPR